MPIRRNVSRRRSSKKTRRSSRFGSRSRSSVRRRSGSYRSSRARISRQELKTRDHYINITAPGGGQSDDFSNIDWCTEGEVMFGVGQGAGPHERIGNVVHSRYMNLHMDFVSAKVISAGAEDAEVSDRYSTDNISGNIGGAITGGTFGGELNTPGYSIPAEIMNGSHDQIRGWLAANAQGSGYLVTNNTSAGTTFGYNVDKGMTTSYLTAEQQPRSIQLQSQLDVVERARSRYVRTVHRLVFFTDRRQVDGQQTVSKGSIFEPGDGQNIPYTGVLSQLNSDNFGRYSIIYDKTFTTDGDDPVKSIDIRGMKIGVTTRYYGPTATANQTGSIYVLYASRVTNAATNNPTDYVGGSCNISGRHCYTE